MEKFAEPVGNEAELIDRFAPVHPDVTVNKMFGYPSAFARGKMFLGTWAGHLVLKLNDTDFTNFVEQNKAQPFAPMGHGMKGFVIVPEKLTESGEILKPWIEKSLNYVSSLSKK